MYNFVNRRGKRMMLMPFYTDDPVVPKNFKERNLGDFGFASPAHPQAVENGKVLNTGFGRNEMLMFVVGASAFGPWTIKTADHHVITPNADRQLLVSVEGAVAQLTARMTGVSLPPAQSLQDDSIQGTVIDIATSLLSGLLYGISGAVQATAPVLYPLGMVITVAFASPDATAPPAPRIDEIEDAVRGVVSEALDKQSAERAGVLFAQNYEWFDRTGRILATYGTDNEAPPAHLVEDFEKNLDDALNPTSADTFIATLDYVAKHPEIGRNILAEYLLGVALALHLQRIHLAKTYLGATGTAIGAIPQSELVSFQSFAKRHRAGLEAARTAFIAMRRDLVATTGLQGTPESIVPVRYITKHYIGDSEAIPEAGLSGTTFFPDSPGYDQSKPDRVASGFAALDQIIAYVDKDVAGGALGKWPEHLLTLPTSAS
ncbi:hypothetical protein GCM10017608_18960 [Agromyces luteolus]|uniref:Uncharacterized protein n=1 Tax=Agromyces luteolus TaxID=88373 RepID=A0A7C9HM79_9MICO|nr:hypothetical protein [Agromyces luteolus]MUN08024.1 hypothetical protein [Agromyces luteolus]GLK27962.1 hypothetical protein GCM10017608_18960 [Agromyces luteolus]